MNWQSNKGMHMHILWVNDRGVGVLAPIGNPDTGKVTWNFKFFDDGTNYDTLGEYSYKDVEKAKKEVSTFIKFRAEKVAEFLRTS